MATPIELSPIARALGRVPTGLYLVTAATPGGPIGFVGSFVMQMGFAPPIVAVAVGKDRPHLAAIRAAGSFGVSVIDKASESLMGRFFRKYEPGQGPFDGLELARASRGTPVVPSALAWFECACTSEHATGDHVIVFGEVVDAQLCRSGDPSVHLRKNGLSY
jgi:flavin reductase (DIM6/NTAB) family NADH-FMN oxidoreductase RutF